jgi:hypothetical protein
MLTVSGQRNLALLRCLVNLTTLDMSYLLLHDHVNFGKDLAFLGDLPNLTHVKLAGLPVGASGILPT